MSAEYGIEVSLRGRRSRGGEKQGGQTWGVRAHLSARPSRHPRLITEDTLRTGT